MAETKTKPKRKRAPKKETAPETKASSSGMPGKDEIKYPAIIAMRNDGIPTEKYKNRPVERLDLVVKKGEMGEFECSNWRDYVLLRSCKALTFIEVVEQGA